jgi:hypothetical protein
MSSFLYAGNSDICFSDEIKQTELLKKNEKYNVSNVFNT